jgi:DNA repair exonuclease SbcCD ATPase subunit
MRYQQEVASENMRMRKLQEQYQYVKLEEQRRQFTAETLSKNIAELEAQSATLMALLAKTASHDTTGEMVMSPNEVFLTNDKIARLRNINVISAPTISPTHIWSCLQRQKAAVSLQEKEMKYHDFFSQIPPAFRTGQIAEVQMYLDKLRRLLITLKQEEQELLRTKEACETIVAQLTTVRQNVLPDNTAAIKALQENIVLWQNMLILSVLAQKVLTFHRQVSQEREEILRQLAFMTDAQRLKQCAIETECQILQQVVDSINACITEVCNAMFDRNITIALSLFKTMKTTHHTKPLVNFNIAYQGGTFDNINQMSGGEGDRASLALTLAMHRLSACPFIMFDESLASLDINTKESAIETIRANTNSTVLVVMHDGIEGIFDHVIDMDLEGVREDVEKYV